MTNSYMKRSSNTINHKQNANEKHNNLHFISTRIVTINKTGRNFPGGPVVKTLCS